LELRGVQRSVRAYRRALNHFHLHLRMRVSKSISKQGGVTLSLELRGVQRSVRAYRRALE
jgi:hypothetical protein